MPVPVSLPRPLHGSPLTVLLEATTPPQADPAKRADRSVAESAPHLPLPAPIVVEVPPTVVRDVDPLRFYSGAELDQGAEPAADVELRFPRLPSGSPRKSRVIVELRINEEGRVVDAQVVESTHPGLWDEQALTPFRNLAFVPARLNGLAVKSVKRIEVGYEEYRDRGDSKGR